MTNPPKVHVAMSNLVVKSRKFQKDRVILLLILYAHGFPAYLPTVLFMSGGHRWCVFAFPLFIAFQLFYWYYICFDVKRGTGVVILIIDYEYLESRTQYRPIHYDWAKLCLVIQFPEME